MKHIKLYKMALVFGVILGIIGTMILFISNISLINKSLNEIEGIWAVVIIISIRISLLSVMCIYVFNKWFKQEEQYISDIPHLFGLFFLLLTFGKILDLFWDLTYFRFDEKFVLFLLKVRFLIIVLELIPLMYLSILMIFYLLSFRERFKKLTNKKYSDKLTIELLLIIVMIEIFVVVIAPDVFALSRTLPFILIPSLIVIIYILFVAYRHQRLSQVHPLIIAIGFLLYTISTILRSVLHAMMDESAKPIIISETIDLFVFIIIFIGLCMKANYSKK